MGVLSYTDTQYLSTDPSFCPRLMPGAAGKGTHFIHLTKGALA